MKGFELIVTFIEIIFGGAKNKAKRDNVFEKNKLNNK